MKTIILYYSRTGNNKKLAQHLKERCKSSSPDIAPIETVAEMSSDTKLMHLLMRTLLGMKTATKNIPIDFSKYDKVILSFPVWIGRVPSPARDALKRQFSDFKGSIYFASLSGKEANPKIIPKIERIIGRNINGLLQLPVSDTPIDKNHAPEVRFDEKDFAKDFYKRRIDLFVDSIK